MKATHPGGGVMGMSAPPAALQVVRSLLWPTTRSSSEAATTGWSRRKT